MAKIKKIVTILILLLAFVPFVSYGTAWDVDTLNTYGLPEATIGGTGGIISAVLRWLTGLLGVLGIIGFVISGYMYITAYGNEDQIKKAKDTMKYSIIGIVVGIAGGVIILTINYFLSGRVL